MIYVYKNHKLFKAKEQKVITIKNGKNGVRNRTGLVLNTFK